MMQKASPRRASNQGGTCNVAKDIGIGRPGGDNNGQRSCLLSRMARGGSHGGGLGAARGAASSSIGATGGVVAHSSTNQVVNINTVQPQTVSPNVSTPLGSGGSPPSAGSGGSPSANVRNVTNAVSPNGLGNYGTVVVQPARGTNTLGTAQSSGLPPNEEGPRKKTDDVIDQENITVDRAVKGICRGC
jgi:hypothetical protein